MCESLKPLPGPRGWPIFGSMFSLGEYRERVLDDWARNDYGPVFKLKIGSREVLAIQGYQANHEAMVEKASSFSGRIEGQILEDMREHNGLFFVQYGEHWVKWNKFTTHALQHMKKQIHQSVAREAEHLVEFLNEKVNEEISLHDYMTSATANVVMKTCYSRRFRIDNPKLTKLVGEIYETSYSKMFGTLLFLPWLAPLSPFHGFLRGVKDRRTEIIKELTEMVHHRRKEDHRRPDLVTCFYQEKESPSKEDLVSLATLFEDLIYAGSLTTASECLWALLYLLLNPEKMRKLREELDGAFDPARKHPIEEAIQTEFKHLNYLKAVVEEAKRIRPIAPTSLFRETTKDTSLNGYAVPKGMAVMPNLWSIQHDPETFPNPEEFIPERFIDSDGKHFWNKSVVPFGMGWRKCVAHRTATVEMRQFLMVLVLHFDIELLTELSDEDMKGRFIGILAPPHFKVKLTRR